MGCSGYFFFFIWRMLVSLFFRLYPFFSFTKINNPLFDVYFFFSRGKVCETQTICIYICTVFFGTVIHYAMCFVCLTFLQIIDILAMNYTYIFICKHIGQNSSFCKCITSKKFNEAGNKNFNSHQTSLFKCETKIKLKNELITHLADRWSDNNKITHHDHSDITEASQGAMIKKGD